MEKCFGGGGGGNEAATKAGFKEKLVNQGFAFAAK